MPAGQSLALKLRNTRFRLLIVEPVVASQVCLVRLLGFPDKLKIGKKPIINLWRTQQESNL